MEYKNAIQRHRSAPAPAGDWRNLMRSSSHEDEVLELLRDHIARWTPQEIAHLPPDCRPGRIRDADDVSRWAFELASTHCAQSVAVRDEPVLERMLEFVTQAALRIAELKAEEPRDIAG